MFSLDITPMKFTHWYHDNEDDVVAQHLAEYGTCVEGVRECSSCEGKGTKYCDLGCPHECDDCDAVGFVTVETDEVLEAYGRRLYNAQVEKDRKKIARFLKDRDYDAKHANV